MLSRRYVAPVLLVLAGSLVYANSLSGAFVIDDRASIVNNSTIRSLSDLRTVLETAPDSPIAGRPVANLTLALNYAVGGLDVTGYHVLNVILHVLCGLVLFGILRRALALEWLQSRLPLPPERVALATTLLWLVHPLNSEVVVYLSQRTESLAALAILGTLYASLRAAEIPDQHRYAWSLVAVLACWVGVFAKEVVAITPVLVLLFDAVFLAGGCLAALRLRPRLYMGLFASWTAVAILISQGMRARSVGFDLGVSPWTYLLNQARYLVRYLRLSVWPDELVALYGWPQELSLGEVWPQAAMVLGLLALTVLALARGPKWFGFIGAWFFLLLAPTSSLLPIVTEAAAERRMYLPSVAVVLLIVLLLGTCLAKLQHWFDWQRGSMTSTALQIGALAVMVVPLAIATAQRNVEFSTELDLARTLVERWPTGVAHQIYGLALMRAGSTAAGMNHLQEAKALGNSRVGAHLARALYDSGRLDAALDELTAFLETARPGAPLANPWLRPDSEQLALALVTHAQILSRRERWHEVEQAARQALSLDENNEEARILLADALFARQSWTSAQLEYRRYLRSDPDNTAAWINLGIAEVGRERPLEAREAFAAAVERDPTDPQARLFLGLIYWQLGDLENAREHAAAAKALGVRDPMIERILAESARQE